MSEKKPDNSLWQALTRFGDGEPVIKRRKRSEEEPSTLHKDPLDTWLHWEEQTETSIPLRFMMWLMKNEEAIYRYAYRILACVVCVVLIVTLLMTVSFLPEFGNPANPANNEVSARYIEEGLAETGSTNLVTGMILDYRGFDTLGETFVLFIAALCVVILLRLDRDESGKAIIREMDENRWANEGKRDSILRYTSSLLIPVIFLFGIYIILNGHLSAGGGFAGGAIIGAGLILYRSAFGAAKTRRFFSYNTFKWVTFGALICYALLKVYTFFIGSNGIESVIPLGKAGEILSAGLILPLNICVGCVVACTMYAFYSMFFKGGI